MPYQSTNRREANIPVVIIPVLTQHYLLLQRNLLYTGITRGKKLVILIGTKKALSIAVRNNDMCDFLLFLTAIDRAFFVPTNITSFSPGKTPV